MTTKNVDGLRGSLPMWAEVEDAVRQLKQVARKARADVTEDRMDVMYATEALTEAVKVVMAELVAKGFDVA